MAPDSLDDVDSGVEDVTTVIPRILRAAPEKAIATMYVLDMVPPSETRVVDLPEARPVIDEALELRAQYRVPFWEAVLLLARRGTDNAFNDVLDAAARHQPMSDASALIEVPASQLSAQRIKRLTVGLEDRKAVV